LTRIIYRLLCFFTIIEQWGKQRLTGSGVAVVIALIFSLVIGVDTRQSLAYQMGTFLLSILGVSMVCSHFFAFKFQAIRQLPRFASVGSPFSYRVLVENQTNKPQKDLKIRENLGNVLPTWTEFQQGVKLSSQKGNYLIGLLQQWSRLIRQKQRIIAKVTDLPTLAPHSKTEVTLTLEPLRRGKLNLQGIIITRADPLGLFNGVKRLILRDSCYILPKRYQIPPIALFGSRKYQSGGVALASSVGDSEEFMSLREYRPGDPLRKIHWRSWAKVGKLIVKEEEDEFFVRHALILDTFASPSQFEALEEAISVAASFACQVRTQESLLDLMFVGTQAYCFTSGRGLAYPEEMLQILASVSVCQDKSFDYLSDLVMSRANLLSGCICVFLDWDEPRQALVRYLEQLRLPLLLLVVGEENQSNNSNWLEKSQTRVNFYYLRVGQIAEDLLKL
jgi:hypothetical protein